MGKLRAILLGTALVVTAGTAGCKITVWWEGNETAITFSWTINGQPPATACSAVGAAAVRMWISQARPDCSLASASCGTWEGAWDWPCAAGAGTTGTEFAAVPMWVGWTLLDASGRVLAHTEWQNFALFPGTTNLGVQDFATSAGDVAAVVTTWTIDGAAAGAATCGAVGAARVYLTYREAGTTAEQSVFWECAAAAGRTANVFTAGRTYELRWDLRDAAERIMSAAPSLTTWQSAALAAGDNAFDVDFPTAATPDATVTSTWTIADEAAGTETCEAANALTVRLRYRPAGTTAESSVDFACVDGHDTSDTVFVSGGDYELLWELRTESGVVLSAAPGPTSWQSLTAAVGDNPFTVDFPVAVGRLDVTLEWADKVTDPSYGDCTWPPHDVGVMGYALSDSTSTVVAEVDIDGAAPLDCTTALAWVGVPFDTYVLAIDARAVAPYEDVWQYDCTGITVAGLLGSAYRCRVAMID